jgi:hypothetical protein
VQQSNPALGPPSGWFGHCLLALQASRRHDSFAPMKLIPLRSGASHVASLARLTDFIKHGKCRGDFGKSQCHFSTTRKTPSSVFQSCGTHHKHVTAVVRICCAAGTVSPADAHPARAGHRLGGQ